MSYDVDLTIDTGAGNKAAIADWNMTSNCAPMWREAGADLAAMDGMPAWRAADFLRGALDNMRAYPNDYRALAPSNGWGSYEGCLRWWITAACAPTSCQLAVAVGSIRVRGTGTNAACTGHASTSHPSSLSRRKEASDGDHQRSEEAAASRP